ncbi:unnamed protein product [Schistocephalus solidus]|uniref:Uncharacterized protein n=1 Tax=Schistocephalus solidus TaxID=70667 RepID=A0A183SPE2_SCHSO|nr:unnamed protein product [Schistocephalus solidus]
MMDDDDEDYDYDDDDDAAAAAAHNNDDIRDDDDYVERLTVTAAAGPTNIFWRLIQTVSSAHTRMRKRALSGSYAPVPMCAFNFRFFRHRRGDRVLRRLSSLLEGNIFN